MLRKLVNVLRVGPQNISKHSEFLVRGNCDLTIGTMDGIKQMKKLGYAFNSDGQLRKINKDGQAGDEKFQFNVSDQHQECQAHYEELGQAVTDYVYHLLEVETNLSRLPVPKDSKNGTFIFVSKDYDKMDTLVVFIHGSGAVRAGQWARSYIINESLDMGSQIPYIKKALEKGYAVVVMNTNDNCLPNGSNIEHSASAEEHASYVWKTYILHSKATNIVIVAHSYGGIVTLTLHDEHKKDFEKRVKAVALTDSVHGFSNKKIPGFMKKVARNWISSSNPLDTAENTPDFDITRVSAGHQKHELTSYCSIDSVFKYIEEKLTKNGML